MAWLWPSYEEFVYHVGPVVVTNLSIHRFSLLQSTSTSHSRIGEAVEKLEGDLKELQGMGFHGTTREWPRDPKLLDRAHRAVLGAVWAGETLLLYDRRLAVGPRAYGFLHQHVIIDHWERYASEGKRIFHEIAQFVEDASALLQGYHAQVEADEEFLLKGLDLPDDLERDFRLARNLFSVGLNDVGLLICGRGFEGVLRKIARSRKLSLMEKGGRATPASEADLHDLIEIMYRVRWQRTKERLISNETRALLQYLRTLRNAGAHAAPEGSRNLHSPRESAAVVTTAANRLWNQVASTRARFESTEIQRHW